MGMKSLIKNNPSMGFVIVTVLLIDTVSSIDVTSRPSVSDSQFENKIKIWDLLSQDSLVENHSNTKSEDDSIDVDKKVIDIVNNNLSSNELSENETPLMNDIDQTSIGSLSREDTSPSTGETSSKQNNQHLASSSFLPTTQIPSLLDGGGIAGALTRLAGLLPMLANDMTTSLMSRLKRRRRRNINNEVLPNIPQHHIHTIENLNRYYSTITKSPPELRPSPQEIKVHRRYLLNLLQQWRRAQTAQQNPADNTTTIEKDKSHDQNVLTDSQKKLLTPPSNKSQDSYQDNSTNSKNTLSTADSHDDTIFNYNENSTDNQYSSRVGQASDTADLQNLGIEEAALLIHQFQTQGNVNLLPPNFLGQPPQSPQQPGNSDLQEKQQATSRKGSSADASFTGRNFQDTWTHRNEQYQSLTSANIDPISGQIYQMPFYPKVTGLQAIQDNDNPASSNQQALLKKTNEEQSILSQSQGSSSILDNFPDKSALLNPQNVPDLIEGLNALAASDQNSQSLTEIVENLPIEFFMNPNLYSDYDSLISAMQLIQQYNEQHGTSSQNGALDTSHPPNLVDLTSLASTSTSDVNHIHNPSYMQHTTVNRGQYQPLPVRDNQIANTRLTTEVNTALENFVENLTMAITTFMTDLADAITENPALLLLGLIPFGLLVFSLYQNFGLPNKGFGAPHSPPQSSYGRLSFMKRHPYNDADFLARRILTNIDSFENWANAEYKKKLA